MVDVHSPSEIECSIEIILVPRVHLNNINSFPNSSTNGIYLDDGALDLSDEIHPGRRIHFFVLRTTFMGRVLFRFKNEKFRSIAVESRTMQLQSDIVRRNRLIQEHTRPLFWRPTSDVQIRVHRREVSEWSIFSVSLLN